MPRTGFESMLPDLKLCKTTALQTDLIAVTVWKIYNLTQVTEAGAGTEKGQADNHGSAVLASFPKPNNTLNDQLA